MLQTKNATFQVMCYTTYELTPPVLDPKIQYIAYGEEVCPTTGRQHLQGFCYGVKPMRLSGWKKLFPGAHIESMRGTLRQNEKYCSKEGKYHELGVKPMDNGHKRVLVQIKEAIDGGRKLTEIVQEEQFFAPVMQYRAGLQWYEQVKIGEKRKVEGYMKPEVHVFVGPTGTNKTRCVFEAEGYENVYCMPQHDMKFIGSYNGQGVVLFDDVSAESIMPIHLFLALTDGYPREFPTKGGYAWWCPKKIYFTSNQAFTEWWPKAIPEHYAAAQRRIDTNRDFFA